MAWEHAFGQTSQLILMPLFLEYVKHRKPLLPQMSQWGMLGFHNLGISDAILNAV